MTTITNAYSSFNELPLVLNAQQLAGVLNISRANAYKLLHYGRQRHLALKVICRCGVCHNDAGKLLELLLKQKMEMQMIYWQICSLRFCISFRMTLSPSC